MKAACGGECLITLLLLGKMVKLAVDACVTRLSSSYRRWINAAVRNGILENHFANCNNITVNCHLIEFEMSMLPETDATRKKSGKFVNESRNILFSNLYISRTKSVKQRETPALSNISFFVVNERWKGREMNSTNETKTVVRRICFFFYQRFDKDFLPPLSRTISPPNCDFKCLRGNVSFACSFPIKIDGGGTILKQVAEEMEVHITSKGN